MTEWNKPKPDELMQTDLVKVEDLEDFQKAYEKHKHLGNYEYFKWNGITFLIGFAKYVILHLEAQQEYENKGNNDSPQQPKGL